MQYFNERMELKYPFKRNHQRRAASAAVAARLSWPLTTAAVFLQAISEPQPLPHATLAG